MNKFEQGQELSASSICDSDCIFTATVIKRTAKTVTIKEYSDEKTIKIHTDDDGCEYCYPHGRHSMCATFHAPAAEAAPTTQEIAGEERDIIEPELLQSGDKVWLKHKTDSSKYYGGLIIEVTSHTTGDMIISIHDDKEGSSEVHLKDYYASIIRNQTSIKFAAQYVSGASSTMYFDTQAEAEKHIQDVYDFKGDVSHMKFWQKQALQMIITKEVTITERVIQPIINK